MNGKEMLLKILSGCIYVPCLTCLIAELLNYLVWEIFAYFIQNLLNFCYKNIRRQSIPWMNFGFFTRISSIQFIFFSLTGDGATKCSSLSHSTLYLGRMGYKTFTMVMIQLRTCTFDRKDTSYHVNWECACKTVDYFQRIHFNFM